MFQNSELFYNNNFSIVALNLTIFTGNALLAWITIVAVFHVLFLNCFIGITMTALTIARMSQIDEFLKGKTEMVKGEGKVKSFKRRDYFNLASPYLVYRLHLAIVGNLFYICTSNSKFYGQIFFLFIVVNVPLNLRLNLWFVLAPLSGVQRLFLLAFIVSQMVGIFGVHFILTIYSERIHRPAKVVLFGHLVRAGCTLIYSVREKYISSRKVSTSSRIKFAWIISLLHTNNKFGITYGLFGLVTLNTFARFVILFGKFLLITYKIHNRLQKISE